MKCDCCDFREDEDFEDFVEQCPECEKCICLQCKANGEECYCKLDKQEQEVGFDDELDKFAESYMCMMVAQVLGDL